MPNGGGYPTIPTIPVGGTDLLANKATTYKDYTCTQVVATGGTPTFSYIPRAGVAAIAISVGSAVGDKLDFYVNPSQLTAASNVLFLCNCSNCHETMTGITAFDTTGYGGILTGGTQTWEQNPNTAFAPTIIGGGGLNN